ncbi:MAG: glycosyltransferase family 4 protein [Sphingobacteriales bacterium]|nr:glycosyltransferase family 4 protein [Sphingobacteriales bacterium]
MDQKRILVYTESFLPSLGGLENNTLLLCKSLSQLGYPVTLLTPQLHAQAFEDFKVVESRSLAAYFKLVRTHDLVIVNGGVSFKSVIPSVLLGKPFWIIYQMASLYKNVDRPSRIEKLKDQCRRFLAGFAQKNIGVSRYSYERLREIFGNKKTDLLINPAAAQFVKQSSPKVYSTPFICLFSGRLIAGKGIHLLVEGIKELFDEGDAIQLRIAGKGPEWEVLQKNPHPSFLLLGSKSAAELVKEYQAAHLTVIPSGSHIEGSPLTLAESLLCGTPVLVSNQAAMTHGVQHPQLVFKSNHREDLKEKLKWIMQAEHYQELLVHSANIAKQYSYSHYFDTLAALSKSC